MMKPCKLTVLHVLNSASGGAAMSTIALMERMKALGIRACAICDDRGTSEERKRLSDAANGNVVFAPLYWWNRKIRSSAWKRPILEVMQLVRTRWKTLSTQTVLESAKHCRADLIHTNTFLTPEGGLAARRLGIPHVWHLRELIGADQPFQLSRSGQALGSYLVKHCDRVIANSAIAAAQISLLLPPGFVDVVPNGIDCSSFGKRDRLRRPDRLVVAMIANLNSRVKRHDLFIEAAGLVDRRLPIEWRIYGHDPSAGGRTGTDAYVNSLHTLAQKVGISDRLRFPGHLPPAQIMNEIDFLVHPSEAESFGRVVVEAMAARVPVIGANGGGVAEIVTHEETGLLFRPADPEDLARSIERMIRDDVLARRCQTAAGVLVENKYSIDMTAQRVAQVYDEVLRYRSPGNAVGRSASGVVHTPARL